jgi:N-acetylglucosaminyldiphosphoundecaprenol N-acetyl-beta-D-mannosaminyltransferase
VLGVRIDGWELTGLLDAVVTWIRDPDGQKKTVLYANVHVLNTAYRSASLSDALRRATTVYCDGSGVRLGAALLGQSLPMRMTAADFVTPLCRRLAATGASMFLLGGADGVAERAAGLIEERHPGLKVAGTHHGYVFAEDDPDLLRTLNASGADIVLVGMGTPLQELWISRNRTRIEAPVVWAVGALFDFIAGIERRGPDWMLANHMEWAARLMANPGRQWRRYLIGNPLFVTRVLKQRMLGRVERHVESS